MLHPKIIKELESLKAYESLWNRALEESDLNIPFLRFEWIVKWWESFAKDDDEMGYNKSLFVVIVLSGERVIGIAPLMICYRKVLNLKQKVISNIINHHSFRSGLVLVEKEAEVLKSILEAINNSVPDWDMIDIKYIPNETVAYSLLSQKSQDRMKNIGLIGVQQFAESPYLPVQGDWDAFWMSKRSKVRNDFKRQLKKLKTVKNFEVVKITRAEEVERTLENIYRIERNSWQYENQTAMSSNSSSQRFYAEIARVAAQKNWLYFFVLRINNEPIAFEYNLKYARKIYNLKIGHNREFNHLAPGVSLKYFILQDVFKNKFLEYDFLGWNEDFKKRWTDNIRDHSNIMIFNHKRILPTVHYFLVFVIWPFAKRFKIIRQIKQVF
jgi:CelD/BcsL family acetyltransferase involved in cellulose biosynthesis